MKISKDYTWYVQRASAFRETEYTDIHLGRAKNLDDYPWHIVHKVRPGCLIRWGVPVSLFFEATHESGLTFKWSIDIESDDGFTDFGIGGPLSPSQKLINKVLDKLPEDLRKDYINELKNLSEPIIKSIEEAKEYIKKETEKVKFLERLCSQYET